MTRAERTAFQAQAVFYGLLGLLVGPPALSLAWWLQRRLTWPTLLKLLPVGLLALGGMALGLAQARSLAAALLWWWGGWLVAGPLVTLLLRGWQVMFDWLRPRTLDEHLAEQEALWAAKNAALSRQAERQEGGEAAMLPGHLTLGVFIKGDRFAPGVGVVRRGQWVLLDEALLNQHMLLIGAPGAGKTETLKRLIVEILRTTDRDIFFVDGKGDLNLAQQVAQLCYAKYGQPTPLFTLGFDEPGAVYHGFRGQATDLYNRLAALIGVDEAQGDAQYYADINRDLLQLICYAPAGPPRSLGEVRRRLHPAWLKAAYHDHPEEAQVVDELDPKLLHSLAVRLRPLVREFGHLVDERGFVLEESRVALFCLRTQSVGDTARRLLNFLVEDLKDFIGKRQQRPGVLIIDEFGAFRNQGVVDLLMLARSANLGVVLATQDIASLGDEDTRRLILADCRTKLLMASDFPEEVAQLAGTIQQVEASIQHQDGDSTGAGSARVQHAFRVDMNEAARLQPGEGFLIRQRYAVKLRTKRVAQVATDPQAIAPRVGLSPPAPETSPPEPTQPPPEAHEIPDLDL